MAFTPSELTVGGRTAARPGADPLRSYVGAALVGGAGLALAHLLLFGRPEGPGWWPTFAAYALGTGLAARALIRHYPHGALGLCNAATQVRLVLVALCLTAVFVEAPTPWLTAALATMALSLDGIDGWLARREGLVSDFGARFDMEVDSALALILAVGAFTGGAAGGIVLLLGLARYAFWGASLALPWLGAPLPPRFSRKAVCVLQIGTLVALHVPALPSAIAAPATVIVALALLWSFGKDILWLWRHEGACTRPV
ncbi:MAG: CDP-alcohol phosphatidyltransferase family protein [Pseudomonadota bacterium]